MGFFNLYVLFLKKGLGLIEYGPYASCSHYRISVVLISCKELQISFPKYLEKFTMKANLLMTKS